MPCITVIATIKAKPQYIKFLSFQLCRLVQPTRLEKGNSYYGFYQSQQDPTLFHSFENWSRKEDVQRHLESCHMKRYFQETQDAVDFFKVEYFYKIC